MISMIPFGLLAGFVGEKEVRITEIDETTFFFRVGRKNALCMEPLSLLKVGFYDIEDGKYNEVEISKYRWQIYDEECPDFYVKIKVAVDQADYTQAVQKLLYQYNKYIHLKLEEDDSLLAKSMTGYPGELDVVKCGSLEEQVKIWQEELKSEKQESFCYEKKSGALTDNCLQGGTGFWNARKCSAAVESGLTELALEVDCPELYQVYLGNSLTEFSKVYAEKCMGICESIIMDHGVPDRLYIGNQFCHLLFPEREVLFQMMEKAVVEQVKITLVFSYIREYMLDPVEILLNEIDNWCRSKKTCIEIVVNDWGMASLVKNKTKNLVPCLGVLLNKRKKDPRISFKKGDQKLFEMNNLNAGFYRDFLQKEYGIKRFEWESCGYEQQLPPGKNSLHIPFYQTNTSQYCPLRAVCESGERGRQKFAKECPEYCGKYALLYPEHLHMLGRYNSLFGIDMGILKEQKLLENYVENGVDRVVISKL